MDIVIPTIRDLEFLEDWRGELEEHHLIIVQDGDPSRRISVPDGFSYDLYDRKDIKDDLGDNSWIISQRDSACRCYGFLQASSKYVYTLDDDCYPTQNDVSVLSQHEQNLDTPSFPTYFNTLYDQEFVRGFPFSRRTGVPTAISHGLWLNIPDFDAPTQMVRPNHRNTERVDIVQTIPEGVLYPMCGMNLSFNRELIGIGMYFGLMGDSQPWGRYDDMWAGWCTKIICDHLGYGVKSGKPYIHHEKASDWKSNLKKEMQGILWQDQLLKFFEELEFPAECKTVKECYLYLGKQVENDLCDLDDYFAKLGKAMQIWVTEWEKHQN